MIQRLAGCQAEITVTVNFETHVIDRIGESGRIAKPYRRHVTDGRVISVFVYCLVIQLQIRRIQNNEIFNIQNLKIEQAEVECAAGIGSQEIHRSLNLGLEGCVVRLISCQLDKQRILINAAVIDGSAVATTIIVVIVIIIVVIIIVIIVIESLDPRIRPAAPKIEKIVTRSTLHCIGASAASENVITIAAF